MIKNYPLILALLLISNTAFSSPPPNVCKDDESILDFTKRYSFQKQEVSSKNYKWTIEIPENYDDELSLNTVSLLMFQTELIGREPRTQERVRDALYVPVQMREYEGVSYGVFYTHKILTNDIKISAVYKKKNPPGVIRFDGIYCEIELIESSQIKLNKD